MTHGETSRTRHREQTTQPCTCRPARAASAQAGPLGHEQRAGVGQQRTRAAPAAEFNIKALLLLDRHRQIAERGTDGQVCERALIRTRCKQNLSHSTVSEEGN